MPLRSCTVTIGERWKLQWAIGAMGAMTLVTVLVLQPKIRSLLENNGKNLIGPAFIGSIAAVVKDVNIGATIINGTACAVAGLVTSLIAWLVLLIAGAQYNYKVSVPTLFIITFALQFIEFHPMGKKLAIAMLTIDLLSRDAVNPETVWLLYLDMIIGIICAIVASLIIWPNSARRELQGRILFSLEACAALFREIIFEWMHLCIETGMTRPWAKSIPSSLQARKELTAMLAEGLVLMRTRAWECRFNPAETQSRINVELLLELIADLLLTLQQIETRLQQIRQHPEHFHIHLAFIDVDPYRLSLEAATLSLADALLSLDRAKIEPLRAAMSRLEFEHSRAREFVYWSPTWHDQIKLPVSDVLLPMNSILFLLEESGRRVSAYIKARGTDDEDLCMQPAFWASYCAWILVHQILPPQINLIEEGTLSFTATRRLRQCFSLSISMIIAAVYGYLTSQDQNFIAAFTIAFLAGDNTAGASILTSLNRVAGTVLASVFSAVVIIFLSPPAVVPYHEVFIGLAIVLFMFAVTYIRTSQTHGYIGTVAGFTAPVLLFRSNTSLDTVFCRIIDTYIGAVIFISMEYLLAPHYSDDVLLQQMDALYAGIRNHFLTFKEEFSRGVIELELSPLLLTHIAQEKNVMLFSSIEVSFFRSPSFRPELIEEVMHHQGDAHNALKIMLWASVAHLSRQTYPVFYSKLLMYLNNIGDFIDRISLHLSSVTEFLKHWHHLSSDSVHCPTVELLHDARELYIGSNEVSRADEIIHCYEESFRALMETFKEGAGDDLVSSAEMLTINTLLASSSDLLAALQGLTDCVLRMNAYRVFRTTQDGTRQ